MNIIIIFLIVLYIIIFLLFNWKIIKPSLKKKEKKI
jgi:hypothetical protein